MPSYRNISFATASSVLDVLEQGQDITVRGKATRELVGRVTELKRPMERYLFLPKRQNNVFAQFAETMWMLAGRNDIGWLSRYLPRVFEFSDDGIAWRGAYGPRLRRWAGSVDQLDAVRGLLSKDIGTRRAVMVLFDPAQDFIESKDIPCNNWLSWIARDGKIHLNVAIRSNDAMWGFSGINSFEWSILHALMAHWLGVEVGTATYFATSFHLYDYHFNRAKQISESFHGLTPYDFGIGQAPFQTSWEGFSAKLNQWFALEEQIRMKPEMPLFSHGRTEDPLLDSGLALIQVFWAHELWGIDRLAKELASLPAEDYVVAMYEQLRHNYPALINEIVQPPISEFFSSCRNRTANLPNAFKAALKRLHASKDRAYGKAWKRRGEYISILPNIARKSDRLETILATGTKMTGETILDTAVDLLVYAQKYRLFLAEELPEGTLLRPGAPQPLSDYETNFDELIDQLDLKPTSQNAGELIQQVNDHFNTCWRKAEEGMPRTERLKCASLLVESAEKLVARIVTDEKTALAQFVRSEFAV